MLIAVFDIQQIKKCAALFSTLSLAAGLNVQSNAATNPTLTISTRNYQGQLSWSKTSVCLNDRFIGSSWSDQSESTKLLNNTPQVFAVNPGQAKVTVYYGFLPLQAGDVCPALPQKHLYTQTINFFAGRNYLIETTGTPYIKGDKTQVPVFDLSLETNSAESTSQEVVVTLVALDKIADISDSHICVDGAIIPEKESGSKQFLLPPGKHSFGLVRKTNSNSSCYFNPSSSMFNTLSPEISKNVETGKKYVLVAGLTPDGDSTRIVGPGILLEEQIPQPVKTNELNSAGSTLRKLMSKFVQFS